MKLNKKEIHYTLFGKLLGNAYLKRNKTTQHWVESIHLNKQKDYVVWLENLYNSWGLKTISKYDVTKITNCGEFTYSMVSCKLQSNRHVEHNRLHNKNGKKYFSKYFEKRITPFGLLLWFLDDGTFFIRKQRKGSIQRYAKISTEKFDFNSHLRIQKMFKNRFDIEVKIHNSKNNTFHIYFNASNFKKFFDLVRPYLDTLPKSMLHKFEMKYVVIN